jgi:hypothetical protein
MKYSGSHPVLGVLSAAASFALFSSCSGHAPTPGETRGDGSSPAVKPDAAPRVIAPDGETPPPGKCADGAAVCLDFEENAVGETPPLGVGESNASITVGNARAASGQQALRLSLADPAPFGLTEASLSFYLGGSPGLEGRAFSTDDLHGRVMIYAAALPAAPWDMIRTATASGSWISAIGVLEDGTLALWSTGGPRVISKTRLPVGKWACLQWETQRAADESATVSLQVDGQPVDLAGGATGKAKQFGLLSVGFSHFGPNDAGPIVGELWLDDLAFGDQPIACP